MIKTMLECWNEDIKTMMAPMKSAPLAFGISRGKDAGVKHNAGMLGCWDAGIERQKDRKNAGIKHNAGMLE